MLLKIIKFWNMNNLVVDQVTAVSTEEGYIIAMQRQFLFNDGFGEKSLYSFFRDTYWKA